NTESEDKSIIFTERLGDLEREREILQARLAEKEDTVRLLQEQLIDTKKLSTDLYEKLRCAEDKIRKLEKDIQHLKEYHSKEVDELNRLMKSLNTQVDIEKKNEITTLLRAELTNKTEQYSETLAALNAKQQELSSAQELVAKVERKCAELEGKANRAGELEKDLIDLKLHYQEKCSKLAECERALEELGGHLSE
uniref:Uncharacterized protein n=1 Tax=Acrobeloides nanus TaxID=290746 RepID=A0A914CX68_9BILA